LVSLLGDFDHGGVAPFKPRERHSPASLPALNEDNGVARSVSDVRHTPSVSVLAHDKVDAIRFHECLGNGCFDCTPGVERDTGERTIEKTGCYRLPLQRFCCSS
jgi:hypothetical protein